jgi:hypothetical protein
LIAEPMRVGDAKRRKAMLSKIKVLLIALVVIVIAGGAFAFAAANTVPDTNAGYVASVVSGYTVTDIVYDLDADDPTLVDQITFNIAPSTGSVLAAVVKLQTETAGTWTECTLGAPTLLVKPVTCTYGALELADVTALNVVASGSLDPAP